jgi:formylglycine-generating enzyme required for sulfatase activity
MNGDKPGLGPYRIEGILGHGGMGVVYEGYDERLDRSVALKRVRRPGSNREEAHRRLRREARALARLNHPSIVQIYDVVETDDGDWVVMELVRGRTLADLAGGGGMAPEPVVELARQMAEGLAEIHAHGLVHRDLKTENVMVTPAGRTSAGRAKILDFGLAESLVTGPSSSSTATWKGRLSGTIRGLAPEQILDGQADARSDLFSFGILLYEALTGRSPFLAPNTAETLSRICLEPHTPVRELRPGAPGEISELIDELLSKERELRPSSAAAVARRLERITGALSSPTLGGVAADAASPPGDRSVPLARDGPTRETPAVTLRAGPPPELPEQPYPVLLPYVHPELMAGREQDLEEIRTYLRLPLPLFGLGAPSGTGKSSFLLAGLVPGLRADGTPVAVVRHPQETGLAARLLGDLLEGGAPEEKRVADEDWRGFVRRLGVVERLAGKSPLLVLDQFEQVLRDDAPTRARVGVLLAATARRRPGIETPLCRWLLVYRQEFHGELLAWLDDVLSEAIPADGSGGLSFLPSDLSGPERFLGLTLRPFATPSPGGDVLAEARQIFRAAIEKPLLLRAPGGGASTSRYGLRFAPRHAERLARAFAEARLARPAASLLPELQVVLAHLVSRAGDDGLVTVPDDPGDVIEEALADHLRQSLENAFPTRHGDAAEVATRRARALLALRELASEAGRRDQGLAAEDLARAIGSDGEAILEELAKPLTRLVVLWDSPGGLRYVLSHDRMAEVVVRVVEEVGRRGDLLLDTELLALYRFVELKTALRGSRATQTTATRIPRRHYRLVAAHAEALVFDDERRAWWAACRNRRRADRVRVAALAVAALVFLTLVSWSTWSWIEERSRHRALLEEVTQGEPGPALGALDRLARDPKTTDGELLALLRRRPVAMDVLEHGLGEIPAAERGAVVLRAVEIALPWVDETPDDPVLIANLVWALDYGPGRDPLHAERARALRDRVLEPLRTSYPPPRLEGGWPPPDDPDWISIPAGTFQMGSPDGEGRDDERPRHEVTLSAFRIQRHEVTSAEYRALVPSVRLPAREDHGTDLPALHLSWYEAYTYASWLGGRLPTEAEWEYAARAGCRYAYCRRDGREARVEEVAWTIGNSSDLGTGPMPLPVMRLEPNPWGLYDMLGNVWEWTADWDSAYQASPRNDPWGPTDGDHRAVRGGAFGVPSAWARVASRIRFLPDKTLPTQGLRVVLPRREAPGKSYSEAEVRKPGLHVAGAPLENLGGIDGVQDALTAIDAKSPQGARARRPVRIQGSALAVGRHPIRDPFRDVAVNVVEPPGVGRQPTHRLTGGLGGSRIHGIDGPPRDLTEGRLGPVLLAEGMRTTGPGRVFPLRLGG